MSAGLLQNFMCIDGSKEGGPGHAPSKNNDNDYNDFVNDNANNSNNNATIIVTIVAIIIIIVIIIERPTSRSALSLIGALCTQQDCYGLLPI